MTVSRRQALIALVSAGVLAPVALRITGVDTGASVADSAFPVHKTDAEWQKVLSPDRYRILRDHRTERAYSSPLNTEKRAGVFQCAGCGQALFSSAAKFDSGTGWPSFTLPVKDAVGTRIDRSWLMVRTEVHCSRCGGHLGHVFSDGPPPTGLRYCINGLALNFVMGSGVI